MMTGQRQGTTPKGRPRPNILIFLADDLSWSHLGHAGDPVVKTPNIDRMAAEGVRFSHAFVSSATCTASRASILTGRHAHELEDGANLNGSMTERYAVYTSLLADAGYHVGKAIKGYGPGKAAGWCHWNRDPAGPAFPSFDAFLRARPQGRPFLFWFGSRQPHRPFHADSGAQAGIPLDRVAMLPYWPDAPEVRGDLADYLYIRNFAPELWPVLETLQGGPTKACMDANKADPDVAALNALSFGRRPAEELYAVANDPYQVHNLAGTSGACEVREELAAHLERIMSETGDPRLEGRQPGR